MQPSKSLSWSQLYICRQHLAAPTIWLHIKWYSGRHQNPTGQEAEQLIVLCILPFPGSSSHHAGFHADGCLLDGSEVVLHGLGSLIPTRLRHLKWKNGLQTVDEFSSCYPEISTDCPLQGLFTNAQQPFPLFKRPAEILVGVMHLESCSCGGSSLIFSGGIQTGKRRCIL